MQRLVRLFIKKKHNFPNQKSIEDLTTTGRTRSRSFERCSTTDRSISRESTGSNASYSTIPSGIESSESLYGSTFEEELHTVPSGHKSTERGRSSIKKRTANSKQISATLPGDIISDNWNHLNPAERSKSEEIPTKRISAAKSKSRNSSSSRRPNGPKRNSKRSSRRRSKSSRRRSTRSPKKSKVVRKRSKSFNHSTESISPRTESIPLSTSSSNEESQFEQQFEKLIRDKSMQKEWNQKFPHGHIAVYTDGSCLNNYASGYGIFYGKNHPLNKSVKITSGEHNSGLAEIYAAQTALKDIKNWHGYNNECVILRTDYLSLVDAMNGGTGGRFSHEYEKLRRLANALPGGVQFQHVYAHEGDPGNEQADALARQATAGARRSRSASVERGRNENRSRSRNRDRSRENNRDHIRSHSAFVGGRRN